MSYLVFLFGNLLFAGTLLAIILPLGTCFQRTTDRKNIVAAWLLLFPLLAVTGLYYRVYSVVEPGGWAFDLISVVNYLLLFAGVFFAMILLYEEQVWQLLLCAVAAYAGQHIISNIVGFVRQYTGLDTLLLSGNAGSILLFFLIQLAITSLVYAALHATFIRVANKRYARGAFSRDILYTSVMALLLVLVLNFFRSLYAEESLAMEMVCGVFSIVCCSFILLIYSNILSRNQLRAEYDTVVELWNKDKKQFALARDSVEMINIKCHDLRKRLDMIEEQGFSSPEEVAALRSAISIYDSSLETGNPALNILLMEYLMSCERHGIRFTCVADGAQLGFMTAEDVYSLFSNLISNAMEAVQHLDEPEKRVISLSIRPQHGMLSVRIENYYDGQLTVKNGALVTRKADRESHGFGTKSMQILVERYEGVLNFDARDGVFSANILFPLGD